MLGLAPTAPPPGAGLCPAPPAEDHDLASNFAPSPPPSPPPEREGSSTQRELAQSLAEAEEDGLPKTEALRNVGTLWDVSASEPLADGVRPESPPIVGCRHVLPKEL